jgi:xanthine dehydrogenase small subunit
MVLLDFIRYHQHLTGTKIGCREGDCGACTILIGELKENELHYSSATCCLMPLGNASGKHIVTIEGINFENELNPIQQAMADEGATQCGFCTPGFVMSLAGFCLTNKEPQQIGACIDGNICRCTGYKSIQRAAGTIANLLDKRKNADALAFATENKILPSYFTGIKEKLLSLRSKTNGLLASEAPLRFVGGGTDLYVQKPDEMKETGIHFLLDRQHWKEISQEGNSCYIGPSATVTDLKESVVMQQHFPALNEYIRLVSSTPIRNMATIAGNFINASPIGDLTVFFLALDARLILSNGTASREVALRKFYKGYKVLDKAPEEFIEKIWFELPAPQTRFHFEKVSKRTHLDIASVNSAIRITTDKDRIIKAGISAGGVGPIPMYLQKTSEFLEGKRITEALVHETAEMAGTEIAPISDARGEAAYKKLLLEQLIKAHFLKLFPGLKSEEVLEYR